MKSRKPDWKTLPPLGTEAFAIEWCSELPMLPGGEDADFDNAVYVTKVFKTEAAAVKYAREKVPLKRIFGAVLFFRVVLEDPYGDNIPAMFRWEAISDPEEVAG